MDRDLWKELENEQESSEFELINPNESVNAVHYGELYKENFSNSKGEFNTAIIRNNINEAKINSARGVSGLLNNLTYNSTSMACFKEEYAEDIEFFRAIVASGSLNKPFTDPKTGRTLNVRSQYKIKGNDLSKVYASGDFKIFDHEKMVLRTATIDDYNTKGVFGSVRRCIYDIDEPVDFKKLTEDLRLLNDITIRHDGDIYGAVQYSQKEDPRNHFAMLNSINRSSGNRNIDEINFDKIKGLTKEQKEFFKNNRELVQRAYKEDVAKEVAPKKMASMISSIKNILLYRVAVATLNALFDRIMVVTGELILKDPDKSWKQCIKDAIKKDSLKKFVRDVFNNIKDVLFGSIKVFFDSMKTPLGFLKKLAQIILGGVAIFAMHYCAPLITKTVRLIIKGLQAGWSMIKMAKAAYDSYKEENIYKRHEHNRNIVKNFVKVIIDLADLVIDLVVKELNIGSLVNVILYTICSFVTFISLTVVDACDKLCVNAINRTKYILSRV